MSILGPVLGLRFGGVSEFQRPTFYLVCQFLYGLVAVKFESGGFYLTAKVHEVVG